MQIIHYLFAMLSIITIFIFFFNKLGCRMMLFANNADSDMKIFGSDTPYKPVKDAADTDAEEYSHHKSSGNIDIAREVGKQLALLVTDFKQPQNNSLGTHIVSLQTDVLYLYAANTSADRLSPGDIIATTIKQSLMDVIKQKKPELYDYFSHAAPFSLYKLADEKQDSIRLVGEIFAKQCSKENDEDYIIIGMAFYKQFVQNCNAICNGVTYCK